MKVGYYETVNGNELHTKSGLNNDGQWENVVYDSQNRVVKRETYATSWDMEAAYCPMTNWARIKY